MEQKGKQNEALLLKYYKRCKDKVRDNQYLSLYADEKLTHSFQVVGAGNYIMRHEDVFKKRADERYLRSAKLAYLFHDIGRFVEIEHLYDEYPDFKKHDHSQYSYEILKGILDYAQAEILLPVKHHGHMIKSLYEDEDYQKIKDVQQKQNVEHIAFLVRDADKIANFYLMKNSQKQENDIFEHLFMNKAPEGELSEKMVHDFLSLKMPGRGDIRCKGDWMLNYLSWIYDLNYQASFDFCRKTGVFTAMFRILDKYNKNKDLQKEIEQTIVEYINHRNQQFERG